MNLSLVFTALLEVALLVEGIASLRSLATKYAFALSYLAVIKSALYMWRVNLQELGYFLQN